jgi:hypothetical protein
MQLKYFIFISLFFWNSEAFSQSNDSLIGYKGGLERLKRDIIKALPTIFYKKEGPEDFYIEYNRYYEAIMKINKDGTIDKSILIFSFMDTVKMPFIINAIHKTDGKWINYTGEDQIIVLPLHFLYVGNDLSRSPEMPFMREDYYLNWTKSKLIYFEPIVSISYAPVH